jgi:hypothetical protein
MVKPHSTQCGFIWWILISWNKENLFCTWYRKPAKWRSWDGAIHQLIVWCRHTDRLSIRTLVCSYFYGRRGCCIGRRSFILVNVTNNAYWRRGALLARQRGIFCSGKIICIPHDQSQRCATVFCSRTSSVFAVHARYSHIRNYKNQRKIHSVGS